MPELRVQSLLDGPWTRDGAPVTIPELPGVDELTGQKSLVYERLVKVPGDWKVNAGERLRVEFDAVNFVSEVQINGQSLGTHVGGWLPFGYDLPSKIGAGDSFTLTVRVQGTLKEPYSTGTLANFPLGNQNLGENGNRGRFSGIVDHVWLRKYGRVAICDAFIQTSVRQKQLTVTYTIENHGEKSETVVVAGEVHPSDGGATQLTLTSPAQVVAAGATKVITVNQPWANPPLWTPDTPHLLVLTSRVMVEGKDQVLDMEHRRFGFREIWIEGNTYMFNGHRINLRGGNSHPPVSAEEWAKELAMAHRLNFNVYRLHAKPGPSWMLDAADEHGIFIINESAFYGPARSYNTKAPQFLQNLVAWTQRWVISARNHPSIIAWSPSNESSRDGKGTGWTAGLLEREKLVALGRAVQAVDPTRVVSFDGDGDIGWETINIHYPEGMNRLYQGSIYAWAKRVDAHRPTGIGEFLTHGWPGASKEPDVFWWQGTLIRGLRFLNFADLRPYTNHYWVMAKKGSPDAIQNLANSYAAVALFDRDYDDLGIEPLMAKKWPTLPAGSKEQRTLILYNDDFSGTNITIKVEMFIDSTRLAQASMNTSLDLGQHIQIPYAFTVPRQGGKILEIRMSTHKTGVERFTESRRFAITGAQSSETAVPQLSIGVEK